MTVNSGIKMLVWIRVFVIGVLGAIVPNSGHSQDIIYDGNSAPNGSNSSQTQTQSIEQPRFPGIQSPVTTDIPSFTSETASQPELNLFDLTATIPEDSDNQIDTPKIDDADLTVKTENNIPIENGSLKTQNDADKTQSEISELSQTTDSPFADNTSDLDKLISELFPAEEAQLNRQINEKSNNASQEAVSYTHLRAHET